MQDVIERFYDAFSRRDAEGMRACYHPDVTFSDPVFTELRGDRARAMWSMLCERGKDLRVEASGFEADGEQGRAHWEAWYTFSGTNRKVHNVIDATFAFRDGLIYEHTDVFDLKRWARQALGSLPGALAGGAWMQKKIRATAAKSLELYISKER